jgi:hypothetical protein
MQDSAHERETSSEDARLAIEDVWSIPGERHRRKKERGVYE